MAHSQIMGGLSKMAYFIFGYFSTKLGSSVDGHEKNSLNDIRN
jgi:hypothetical protein